jgi:hypothetical protein
VEVDDRTFRDLEARIMNLEVAYVPVSKSDLEKRWVAVRETMDTFSGKLVGIEIEKRGLNETVTRLIQQNAILMEMVSAQTVQHTDMMEQLKTVTNRLQEHLDGDLH